MKICYLMLPKDAPQVHVYHQPLLFMMPPLTISVPPEMWIAALRSLLWAQMGK